MRQDQVGFRKPSPQGTVQGKRRQGKQLMKWADNIVE